MNVITDFLADFFAVSGEFPVTQVAVGILLYIFILWLVISIWVYYDAKKRYAGQLTPMLFGLLVLLLNVPMLIFYFAVRPDLTFDDFDDWDAGGVNVPVVNFVGKDGIEMSFELRIHPTRLRDPEKSMNPDMKIQIDWEGDEGKFKIAEKSTEVEMIRKDPVTLESKKVEETPKRKRVSMVNYFDKFSGKIMKYVGNIKPKAENKTKFEKSQEIKESNLTNLTSENAQGNMQDARNISPENLQDRKKKKKKKKKKR